MPIYEYRCATCGRKASLFFRSVGTVEENPACPYCGQPALRRLMSRVWSRRSRDDASLPEPSLEVDDVPFYGPDPFGDPYGDTDVGGDLETGDDLAAMAREARTMARLMGEPLDPAFDQALRHVEQGADPDDVFGELDAAGNGPAEPAADSE